MSHAAPAGTAATSAGLPSIPGVTQVAQAGDLPAISRSNAARKVEVSSPKGTRTWSASSLTDNGLPAAARRAYENAARAMATSDPACQLPWTLLAGVGRVESDHGRYGGSVLGQDGVSHPLIIGVPLNGFGPVAAIRDTDRGRLDKDEVWDRAVGPMQFIPSTWANAARDGDGDGTESPNDIDDAALAAAAYLCAGSGSVLGESAMRAAIFSYNASEEYVALVMAMEEGYRTGVFIMPAPVVDEPADRAKRKRDGARGNGPRGNGPGGSGGGSSSPKSDGKPTSAPSPNPNPPGGSTGGGGGGGKGDGSNPTPSPTPTPSPKPPPPPPEPKPVVKSGVLTACGPGWCLGGGTLNLGSTARTTDHDYDGDKVLGETIQQELEELAAAGTQVTVVVLSGAVIEIAGKPYP